MKKPIDNLDAVEQVMRTYLSTPGATALRTTEPWIYVPPGKILRRRRPVTFPHPHTIECVDEAKRWACQAEDVAAELKVYLTFSLLIIAFLLSLTTLLLATTLSTIGMDAGSRTVAQAVATAVGVGAILGMGLFARGPQQAPVWERRAMALRARAEELAAARARSDEQEWRRASLPRSWWRGRRR